MCMYMCVCVCYQIGPARAPQYRFSGTTGYGYRAPQQFYGSTSAPAAYQQYSAGLSEEEQIAAATRQSLGTGENCATVYYTAR